MAAIQLPALFADGMVLQQKTAIAIWGQAAPHEQLKIISDWNKRPINVYADGDGAWLARIQTPQAGGPYSLTVASGEDSVTFTDVWIGEVWLCSGQSNMEFPLANQGKWKTGVENDEQEIAAAHYPFIRMFNVAHAAAKTPVQDVAGRWEVCTPETAGHFSAVAYYFARKITQETGYPIGIIHASWGGTPAESWVKKRVWQQTVVPDLRLEDIQQPWSSKTPTALYNGMIAPLIPFTISGVVWYQGESNADRPEAYKRLFPALINSWRTDWQSDFPFYFVQIAPHYQKNPFIREAQLYTFECVKNTGMVVVTDAADSLDIHPRNKRIPGERLARWALAQVYGKKIAYSGPIYRSMKIEGNKIRLFFDYACGLTARGGSLKEFVICGADQLFVPAIATIENNTILVYSNQITKPLAVRFAWKNYPRPNLYNCAGLPASPFRTDQWKKGEVHSKMGG